MSVHDELEELEEFDDLQYSLDVLWVYRKINSHVSRRSKGSSGARYALWQWAQNPEHQKEFFKTIVPKAQDVIRAAKSVEEDEELVKREKKSIAELREFLDRAIQESKSVG